MILQWPFALFLMGLLPLVVLAYIWVQRRRRRFAVRYSSLSLLREALPAQSRLRRYLPPALFLLALASLIFAFSRPAAVTLVPAGRANIILALDVSGSMRQMDIYPSRIQAAKNAALSFVDRQKANNQIGVVAFAGFAQLVQPPTTNSEDLRSAIAALTLGRGTAIGSGILEALNTISTVNPKVAAVQRNSGSNQQVLPSTGGAGSFVPDIVVLLTDGVPTTGPDPLEAAQQAVERGVRVYTIGFGTRSGDTDFGNSFGGGGGRGGFNRGIDEASLKQIAAMTGGEYYSAASASELQKVFDKLPTYLITRQEKTEISFAFSALGAVLVIAAVILSQLWHPLP